jgi:hypothetical protein
MTVKSSGLFSELFACHCHGMPHPIGFEMKGVGKGVVVSYEPLPPLPPGLDDDPAAAALAVDGLTPPPLGGPTDPQYHSPDPLPAAAPTPKLDFGPPVPLFERRTLRFVVRNLSAIACPFTIQPTRYKVSRHLQRLDLYTHAHTPHKAHLIKPTLVHQDIPVKLSLPF